jgi:ferrous iron transport protein B
VAKKLWIRISNFLREAVPLMLLGVFSVNLLYVFGVFDTLAVTIGPFLNRLFGLPDKAISALLMGFLRKDLAMGMLAPLGLTAKQLVTASTVLTIYFPCIATFAVLLRELGIIDMLRSTIIMLITTLIVGGFVNLTFSESGFTFTGWLIIVLVFIAIKYIPARVNGRELNSFTHN